MMKLFYLSAKVIGILLMVTAFLTWITYDYPEYNIFRIGGGGLLDIGLTGTIGLMINWALVVVQATAGWYLFSLKPKPKNETQNGND